MFNTYVVILHKMNVGMGIAQPTNGVSAQKTKPITQGIFVLTLDL